MKTIEKKATATTEKGTILNMIVIAKRGWGKIIEHHYCDGDEMDIEKMHEINEENIIININGQNYSGHFATGKCVPKDYQAKGIYAIFANKIALSERVYNELNSVLQEAIQEAESDEGWQKLQTRKENAKKEAEEYERHVRNIENMMTLNGRSY